MLVSSCQPEEESFRFDTATGFQQGVQLARREVVQPLHKLVGMFKADRVGYRCQELQNGFLWTGIVEWGERYLPSVLPEVLIVVH